MATWYISPTGNDSTGTGSNGSPWQTISKAHTSASSGDTIICKTSATAYTWASQTFTKNLTIQGESTPVYDPITKAWTGSIFSGGGSTVRWNASPQTIQIVCTNLIFTNVTGAPSNNSLFESKALTLTKCVFHTLGWSTNNQTGWLHTPGPDFVTVLQSCIFYAPTTAASEMLISTAYGSFSTGSTTVTNCVYRGAIGIVKNSSGVSATMTFKNNIFINPGSSAALFQNASSGNTYSNNIAYGTWTGIPSGSNNLTSDPLLVDAANGDFRLRPSSPAVNTGIAL